MNQPQRALTHIKRHHPTLFIPSLSALFSANWGREIDTSSPAGLHSALSSVFSLTDLDAIVLAAGTAEVKAELNRNTERAWKECGAFGAPWFWVTNGKGVGEPFFGSDRWGYMWRFLGLPFEDLRLRAKL